MSELVPSHHKIGAVAVLIDREYLVLPRLGRVDLKADPRCQERALTLLAQATKKFFTPLRSNLRGFPGGGAEIEDGISTNDLSQLVQTILLRELAEEKLLYLDPEQFGAMFSVGLIEQLRHGKETVFSVHAMLAYLTYQQSLEILRTGALRFPIAELPQKLKNPEFTKKIRPATLETLWAFRQLLAGVEKNVNVLAPFSNSLAM